MGKKITTLVLLTIFLVTMILPIRYAKALTKYENETTPSASSATSNVTEVKANSELTNWVLDEGKNTLYAISYSEKKLLVINAKTLAVENSIIFNGYSTDIVKDNGSLYVSFKSPNGIAVVDMTTRKTTKILKTTSDPYRIVKH